MPNQALISFKPTCEDDAKWYACEATSSNRSPFVGCCKTDPCSVNGCALGNLGPVSFSASAYGTLPDPSCGAASTFYSCVNIPKNDTTFWGCCKTNACNHPGEPDNKSCPHDDLTPAVLDTASLQQAYSRDGIASNGSSHTAIIVGAVVGGVAVVAIIALLIFCLAKKRRNARNDAHSASSPSHAAFPSKGEKTEYRHSAHDEAPPMYNSPQPPPFTAFGQHQYAPVAQAGEPQELPADFTAGSTQRYSELPAEARAPVELESPMVSPQPFASPKSSSRVPWPSRVGEETGERPVTADTTSKAGSEGLGIARPR